MKRIMMILGALLMAAVLASPARAQDEGTGETKDKKEKKKGGGPIILDEIVIEGRVQKPQAFYILQRSTFGYKITEIEEDYTDEIVESVKDEVF